MAGNKGWVLVEGGKEHPENSILLAYTRKQQLEDRLGIRRHIDECPRCLHKCGEFERDSIALETLEQMRTRLDYSDVPSVLLVARIESKYGKYERSLPARVRRYVEPIQQEIARGARLLKPRRPLSFVSFHALLALMLLTALLAAGMVLAFQVWHINGTQFILDGGIIHETQSGSVSLPKQQAAATVNPGSGGAQNPTTIGSGLSKGNIRICTTDQDRADSRLRICGSDFKPGDRVALLITMGGSGQPKQRHAGTVDGHGEFQVTISVNNCNLPVAIQAHDLTNPKVDSNIVRRIKFGGCRMPSPNLGPGSKNP